MKRLLNQTVYYLVLLALGFGLFLNYLLKNRLLSYFITLITTSHLMFAKRKQKLSGKQFIRIELMSLAVSFLALVYGRSDSAVSFRGNLLNVLSKFIFHHTKLQMVTVKQAKPYVFGSWSAPDGYVNQEIHLTQSRAYLLTKQSSRRDKVIYQIHGGAYIACYFNLFNKTALRYSHAYDDADVFSIDYRTAPDHVFPCALEDAVEGYQWLLENGYAPENIIVTGDSAGGGLALSMTLKLRDTNQLLPKMLILSSPWADLSASGPSYKTNIQIDPFFGSKQTEQAPTYPVPITYAGNHDVKNPYISPVYGTYEKMPPMLIQTGTDELLLSDSEIVAQKAKEAGVDVTFIKYQGMYHTFYIITPRIPEGQKAWKEIKRFIHQYK